MRRVIVMGLLAALAACGKSGNERGPGPATADEARALDDAAQMLDTPASTDDASAASGKGGAPAAAARR